MPYLVFVPMILLAFDSAVLPFVWLVGAYLAWAAFTYLSPLVELVFLDLDNPLDLTPLCLDGFPKLPVSEMSREELALALVEGQKWEFRAIKDSGSVQSSAS